MVGTTIAVVWFGLETEAIILNTVPVPALLLRVPLKKATIPWSVHVGMTQYHSIVVSILLGE